MGRRALVFAAACAVCSAGSHVRADAPASGGEPAVRAYEEFCVTCHQMKFPVPIMLSGGAKLIPTFPIKLR